MFGFFFLLGEFVLQQLFSDCSSAVRVAQGPLSWGVGEVFCWEEDMCLSGPLK